MLHRSLAPLSIALTLSIGYAPVARGDEIVEKSRMSIAIDNNKAILSATPEIKTEFVKQAIAMLREVEIEEFVLRAGDLRESDREHPHVVITLSDSEAEIAATFDFNYKQMVKLIELLRAQKFQKIKFAPPIRLPGAAALN